MEKKALEQGFSEDGYITDQDCFSSIRYRTMPADWNGCGPIAAYNLRRWLGQEPEIREVYREMDALHRLHAPGPTTMRVMRLYLSRYAPDFRETEGREAALAAAAGSRAGIFRYREGQEPHFISYIRTGEESFRFFNVDDGLEDCTMSMAQFGEEHLKGGLVIALTLE